MLHDSALYKSIIDTDIDIIIDHLRAHVAVAAFTKEAVLAIFSIW